MHRVRSESGNINLSCKCALRNSETSRSRRTATQQACESWRAPTSLLGSQNSNTESDVVRDNSFHRSHMTMRNS
jgi:hypothetical protein